MHETVIVQVMPIWARMALVVAVTGLPHYTVRRLFNEGRVRAVKCDPDKANSATVYKLGDVLEWMDTEGQPPPLFKLPEVHLGKVS